MTTLNKNEFINTIGNIRKYCGNKQNFIDMTFGLCLAYCRGIARKKHLDNVSWVVTDDLKILIKNYTNMDTLDAEIIETL